MGLPKPKISEYLQRRGYFSHAHHCECEWVCLIQELSRNFYLWNSYEVKEKHIDIKLQFNLFKYVFLCEIWKNYMKKWMDTHTHIYIYGYSTYVLFVI